MWFVTCSQCVIGGFFVGTIAKSVGSLLVACLLHDMRGKLCDGIGFSCCVLLASNAARHGKPSNEANGVNIFHGEIGEVPADVKKFFSADRHMVISHTSSVQVLVNAFSSNPVEFTSYSHTRSQPSMLLDDGPYT